MYAGFDPSLQNSSNVFNQTVRGAYSCHTRGSDWDLRWQVKYTLVYLQRIHQ